MAEIRWSLTAESDLLGIETFIAKDSALHAVDFIDRLVGAAEKLSTSPKMGRIVPAYFSPIKKDTIAGPCDGVRQETRVLNETRPAVKRTAFPAFSVQ